MISALAWWADRAGAGAVDGVLNSRLHLIKNCERFGMANAMILGFVPLGAPKIGAVGPASGGSREGGPGRHGGWANRRLGLFIDVFLGAIRR